MKLKDLYKSARRISEALFTTGMLVYLLYLGIKYLVIGVYTVPSNSMLGTIWPGDRIVIEKLSLGPRLNMGDNTYRLPGLSDIKRGDIITFNFPEGDTVLSNNPTANYYEVISYPKNKALAAESYGKTFLPVQWRVPYVKRCVGLPGDIFHITNGLINVWDENKELQIRKLYQVHTQTLSYKDIAQHFKAPQARAYPGRKEILMGLTNDEYQQLMALEGIDSITRRLDGVNYVRKFPDPKHTEHIQRQQDNYGPLTVPKKDMQITLSKENRTLYQRVIEVYESNQFEIRNDSIFINQEYRQSYTFQQDYYFVMGDNRAFTTDSRNWGFVPKDHIIGRAFMIGWSKENEGNDNERIRWDRIGNGLN